MLQKNLKEEYRAVVDYEVAFFNTVCPFYPLAPPETPLVYRACSNFQPQLVWMMCSVKY